MDSVSLYKKDSRGQIREWSCTINWDSECLVIEHGVLHMEMQIKEEFIDEGKGGRDVEEQLLSRFNSRVNKKLDNGYARTPQDAELPITNALGLLRPMKATPTVDKHLVLKQNLIDKVDWSSSFLQRKYNGLRCLIKNECGELIAYSRGGKRWGTLDHILSEVNMPEGATVDGELYHHGTHLQTINSWAKRLQPGTWNLKYMMYDAIIDAPYEKRLGLINKISDASGDSVFASETIPVYNMEDCTKYFKQFRDDGYEGAILRHGCSGYEVDRRSKSLLKLKAWFDEEFIVEDIIESDRDGVAVLCMRTDSGLLFKATAPGSFREKRDALRNKGEHIGFSVTIRYAELTKDGKPAQPVAIAWREKGE